MNKKTISTIAVILSVLILSAFCALETIGVKQHRQTYQSLRSDINTIIKERQQAELGLDTIYFDDIPAFYDSESKCYYYSLRESDPNAYNPNVSWNSNDVNIAFENTDIDDVSIYNNTSIKLLIYNEKYYSLYSLKCTTLPLINIEKFSDSLNYNYDNVTITIYDNRNDSNNYDSYNGKVRIRGGNTAEYSKPGLRIELDYLLKGDNNKEEKKYEVFGLEPDNEFVLYTSNIEKDHIRNVFSTNLWYDTCASDNSFDYKLGMSYRYCEVFINGKYWGLCALGNPISKKRNYVDLDYESSKYPRENIYKLNFFGDRERLNYELYGNDYLFAIKTNENNKEAWQPFIDYIKLLLNSKDSDALYASVDLDNAVDIYLFYNMIQAWDNAWYEDNLKFRNTYLVSKVIENNIKMLYIPWDLDRTWGHCREDDLVYPMDYTSNYDMVVTPIENLLDNNDPQIKGILYDKYKYLRSDKWSDKAIMDMLNKYEKQVYGSGAFFRDRDRWPDNYHDDNMNLDGFKEYVFKRIHYFDEYVEQKYR